MVKQRYFFRAKKFIRTKQLVLSNRAAVAIEFALLAPVLILLLFASMVYANYYFMAHNVQQFANDAARSTVAGLTTQERVTLANSTVLTAAQNNNMPANKLTITTTDQSPYVKVAVSYNMAGNAIFRIGLVPLPDPVISRTATIRMGGL